jgi:hypothetical protein
MSCLRMKYTKLIKLTLICNNSCSVFRSSIPAKQFRPPFSCHFTKIGCSLTFIVIMIDVCKLKFEIYYCHPYEFRHNLIDTCQHVKLFVPKGYFTACCGRNFLFTIVQLETRNFGHHCQYTVKKCKIGFTLLTSMIDMH